MEPPAPHRNRRGARPLLPAFVGEASDLSRLQGVKHPPGHGKALDFAA
jgi:hypothetical protein